MIGTSKEKTGASFVQHVDEGPIECSTALTEKLDLLFEKRHTVREAAIKIINSTLSTQVCSGCIENRQERLADALQFILQRNLESECLLALRCVSLASICLQEGKVFYTHMEETLTKIITDESLVVTPVTRAAAIASLAMVCFMNSVDPDHTVEVSYTLSGIFYEDNTPANVISAAVEAWTLLLSTVDDKVITDSLFPENVMKLDEFLDHSDSEVRAATGRALAVLVEALRNQERVAQGLSDYDTIDLDSIESSVPWEDITSKLETLSQEKFRAQSKVEGKKQKKLFRQMLSSIQEGHPPCERLTIRDVDLEIDNWAQITQLDRLRSFLGEGFIQHMTQNGNMMNMFDYYVDPEPTTTTSQYSKKERRRSMIEAEKEYTRYIDQGRKMRARDLAGFASE